MYTKLVTFNCKSFKRSIEDIRGLCKSSDIILLQETWLMPYDLPMLSTVDSNFDCTGTSAVDTSAGLLQGRPHGGVAVLWRKSAFTSVSVIKCDNARITGVSIKLGSRSVIIFSVYMPVNCSENLPEFTECLSVISSIIEEHKYTQAVYILGDFNAHPGTLFYGEMLDFCKDQNWSCFDIDFLGILSNSYTFVSDVHGCGRWLDHCLVSEAAKQSIRHVRINHDTYWSDHFPLFIEINVFNVKSRVSSSVSSTMSGILWGERDLQQINKYHELCNTKLRAIDFPIEFSHCSDGILCHNENHKTFLDKMYKKIVNVLSDAASETYVQKKLPQKKGGYITGWNQYVSDAHKEARSKFIMWVQVGKPRQGRIYNEMCKSRNFFKSKLKWCQNRQEQIKMDLLATNHSAKHFKNFWKHTNKMNIKPSLPACVDGITDQLQIANTFKEHFMVKPYAHSISSKNVIVRPDKQDRSFMVTTKEVSKIINKMHLGKSPGHDGLSVEHLKYAGFHLPRVLSMFFNFCLGHAYIPSDAIKTIVVPIIKDKTGDVSDKNNYRPISLATVIVKVLDSLINKHLEEKIDLNDAQFGFRAGLSTESAIFCLKHTVNYYTKRKTPIYACFLDLSKAFDTIIYSKLWQKLDNVGIPKECISLLKYWYENQKNQVRWANTLSDPYGLKCGVRQGGLSSPLLFNLYIDGLINELSHTHTGCYIDNTCVNNINYADDMVLIGPSINSIRKLVQICESYATDHGLKYNTKKSVLMVFNAGKVKPFFIPPVNLDNSTLKIVNSFKYLGHIISDNMTDDADIDRERRALAVRGNMLARRFARCTDDVKITLFKAFCQSMYTSNLWVSYTRRIYNVLRVQYNNIFRILLRLPRFCSASTMFAEARTDGFNAIIRKKVASIMQRVRGSRNTILRMIAARPDCPIQNFWIKIHLNTL